MSDSFKVDINKMNEVFANFDEDQQKKKKSKELKEKAISQLIAGVLINPWIFQFILWRFVHRDIPWFMDIWVGLFFTNKYFVHILTVLWIGTLVASYCGIDYPFFILPLEK